MARPGEYVVRCYAAAAGSLPLQLSARNATVKFGIIRIARFARGVPPTPASWTDQHPMRGGGIRIEGRGAKRVCWGLSEESRAIQTAVGLWREMRGVPRTVLGRYWGSVLSPPLLMSEGGVPRQT